MSIMVYKFGALAPTLGKEFLQAEHERMTALWNDLVQLEIDHNLSIYKLVELDSNIPQLEEEINELKIILGQFPKKAPEFIEALKQIRVNRKTIKKIILDWKKENTHIIKELAVLRVQNITKLRRATTAWWPNYNKIIQNFEAAVKLNKQTGRRLHKKEGILTEGHLNYQIQKTVSGVGASTDEIISNKINQVQWTHLYNRVYAIQFRVDNAENTVTIPIILHRPLPADARIKVVQLTWRTIGGNIKYDIMFTCSLEQVTKVANFTRHGTLKLMWELQADGSLGVAILGNKILALPLDFMHKMKRLDNLNQLLDVRRNRINAEFPDEPILKLKSEIEQHTAIRQSQGSLPQEILDWDYTQWRTYQEFAHLHNKMANRKKNIYNVWASMTVREFSEIIINNEDYTRFNDRNALRQIAAPGILRDIVKSQASKHNASVICLDVASGEVVKPKITTKTNKWKTLKRLNKQRSQI